MMGSHWAAAAFAVVAVSALPAWAQTPVACPSSPIEVVRSRGGVIDNYGSVPGIADLCRIKRSDQTGEYYYGIWKTDWPGAGQAYPAIKKVITGSLNTRVSFRTDSVPGMQWIDTFVNEGLQYIDVSGHPHLALRVLHERNGIEGNTYHSLITSWRDVQTGVTLQTNEEQISGQSYGPDTTWRATAVQPISGGAPKS